MDLGRLYEYVPKIERTLSRSYGDVRRKLRPSLRPYVDVLDEFTLRGGKRFRALLVLAGYHLASGRAPDPVLPAAAALEHFQSWMLVHDDIIDHADERRGGPAVHRLLAREHVAQRGGGDAESYGVGLGITLGDLEEPFTLDALLKVRADPSRRLRALEEYVRMTRSTAFGQALDIRNGARPVGEVSESDVLLVHELKSAIYTVASPLRIGATLGGAGVGLLDELGRFGLDSGIAFQLRDDVLGAGFDAESMGKSANDIVEGKRTLLVVRAWQRADPEGRQRIERALGNPRATPDEVAAAQSVIRSTGSLDYSERRIVALSERALRRVRASHRLSTPGKALLVQIAQRLTQRRI